MTIGRKERRGLVVGRLTNDERRGLGGRGSPPEQTFFGRKPLCNRPGLFLGLLVPDLVGRHSHQRAISPWAEAGVNDASPALQSGREKVGAKGSEGVDDQVLLGADKADVFVVGFIEVMGNHPSRAGKAQVLTGRSGVIA